MSSVNISTITSKMPTIAAKMPEPKRCCFCIPLRHGLLVWGYIKLILTLLLFINGTFFVYLLSVSSRLRTAVYMMANMGSLLYMLVDSAMTIVFLIGGHKKTLKLMRIFYIYSIVLLVVTCILFVAFNFIGIHDKIKLHSESVYYAVYYCTEFIGFAFIGVQAYVVVLLRSEIIKLASRRKIKFSNITKEVECIAATENGNVEPVRYYDPEEAK